MRYPRRVLGVISLSTFFFGCASQTEHGEATLADLQWQSLGHVYYTSNPYPSRPGVEEIREAQARLDAAAQHERDLLTALYPDDPSLQALAIRDQDGDGVPDYRISDYYGRFLEGDTDADGDGEANVLDSDPYDAAVGLTFGEELPAHLAWRNQGKPTEMVRMQEQLFHEHDILLVERSAEFTPELARAVFDVVTRVYASLFSDGPGIPTLSVIATEESSLLFADAEEGTGDFAQVFPATQTMEIYRLGIDSPPVIQLGFVAHEIAHSIQFAMDYDDAKRDAIVRENRFDPQQFHELVRDYGWSIVPLEADPENVYRSFRPQYLSIEPWTYLYLDTSPEDWQDSLAMLSDELGPSDYLADPRVSKYHIVGDYSLTNPWEWYSDHVIAYVYLEMLGSLEGECSAADIQGLADELQGNVVFDWWPAFRFENARGAPIQHYLAQAYPLAADDIRYLTDAYLLPELPGHCGP
jgi:hypothetical protein